MWWGPSKILTNQNSAGARTGLWGNQVEKGQCAHRVMGKSSAKRSMHAQARAQGYWEIKCKKVNAHTGACTGQARAQGYGEIKCKKVNARTGLWGNQVQKGQCAHRRTHRVMGKSSAKRSMRAQARAQGYGEIKCKKVNAHTGMRTGLWGNQVQKGQCAHRCAHRVMGKSSAKRSMHAQACAQGKSSAKRSMRAQARAQGYGEIKCKKVNERTGACTGLWGNQVQKGQCVHRRAHRRTHRVMGKSSAKRSMGAQGYGEIKCKKVNARTGARTGLWGNQVQKGQCAHRRGYRVMGKSSAKRSMHAQVAHRVMGNFN